jgi:hypothetical protein
MVETRNNLRSTSVLIYTFFTTGDPKVLVNLRSKGIASA